ncbi:hypothetical protein D3C80_1724740 [compost metagenome]
MADYLLYTSRQPENHCRRPQRGTPVLLVKRKLEQRCHLTAFLEMPALETVVEHNQLRRVTEQVLPVAGGNIERRYMVKPKIILLAPIRVAILCNRRDTQRQQIILQKRGENPCSFLV